VASLRAKVLPRGHKVLSPRHQLIEFGLQGFPALPVAVGPCCHFGDARADLRHLEVEGSALRFKVPAAIVGPDGQVIQLIRATMGVATFEANALAFARRFEQLVFQSLEARPALAVEALGKALFFFAGDPECRYGGAQGFVGLAAAQASLLDRAVLEVDLMLELPPATGLEVAIHLTQAFLQVEELDGLVALAAQGGQPGLQFGEQEDGAVLLLGDRLQLLGRHVDAAVEVRHPGQVVDDAAALMGRHLDDAHDVHLHDDVEALRADVMSAQQLVDVRQGRSLAVQVVGVVGRGFAAVGGLALAHAARHLEGRGPVLVPEAHGHTGLAAARGAIDEARAVGCAKGPGVAQAKAEHQRVENVALAGSVGAGDGRKARQEANPLLPERLEVVDLELDDAQAAHSPTLAREGASVR